MGSATGSHHSDDGQAGHGRMGGRLTEGLPHPRRRCEAFDEEAKPVGLTGHLLITHPLPEHLEEVLDDHVSNSGARGPPQSEREQTLIVG